MQIEFLNKSLKKLYLLLRVGSSEQEYNYTPEPVPFDFIYGIGHQGITPFEKLLTSLNEGESTSFALQRAELQQFFGKQAHQLRQVTGMHLVPEQLYFEVQLTECLEPEPREMVQAMAKTIAHGCGGGCDCGCS